MRLKKKDICTYTLYFLIFLLITLIIYYSYKILYKNKIEHFNNVINFLDNKKTIDFLNRDYDNYVKNLSKFDLIARNVDSSQEYIINIIQCAKNFTENQKNIITNCCEKADNFLNNYNELLDGKQISKIKWNIALTSKSNMFEYENGLPHTRENIIFLSDKTIPETETTDFVNILIHEKIHVYQRQNETIVDKMLSNKLKFEKITYYNPRKRANPDLNKNTYIDKDNKILQCYYNSDNPNSIQDVTCLDNNDILEHPYEFLAYNIANEYNKKQMEKYINI
tara:strand:- start:810 stop:1649 length:840 start_codon:yes stop_codon:yes gene_type:complete